MKDFNGKIAVVTGGGTGMGRALVRQLLEQGCHVATCDVIAENLQETVKICADSAAQGVTLTTHLADVANEDEILAFRDEAAEQHNTTHINLLFNNAGIGGGGSFVNASRDEWERVFNICWNGVYLTSRAFLPLMLKSTEGHIINTSSVNGFRASLGGNIPHTAYSAAKFAVKGFTEALINDFRFNAPHLHASVVMPGYVGTQIAVNTGKILGHSTELTDEQAMTLLADWKKHGRIDKDLDPEQIRALIKQQRENYDKGGLTPEQAATIILDGVKAQQWRILVGPDAVALDEAVRRSPLDAYDLDFTEKAYDYARSQPESD